MKCQTCNNKIICKHLDYINSNLSIEVEVKNCDHHTDLLKLTPATLFEGEAIFTGEMREYELAQMEEAVTPLRDITVDYNIMSKEANKDRFTDDFKVTAIPTELVECENSNCLAKIYEEDKAVCDKCGKPVCPVCAFSDMKMPSNDNEEIITYTLCTECFGLKADDTVENTDETLEDILNNLKKELSSEGEEK